MNTKEIIDRIATDHFAEKEDILAVIQDNSNDEYLFESADRVRREIYGTDVFIRGLIEISNYCKNNCLYCGIRRDNREISRYRLTEPDILLCCDTGYELGFRTFVIQGGEDIYFSDDVLCSIIKKIKEKYPDCAVTISMGERSEESYKKLFSAGADRYLLRHETSSKEHYEKLHPEEMSFENRMKCLKTLKQIGYQTGAGFMVGSPYQTKENLVSDLLFLKELEPEMAGIGPFIAHKDTPFRDCKNGSLRDTLVMVALTRLLLPHALIPSTTALGTIDPKGRELGLKAGANVVMPNLSPVKFRKLYALYDNKICMGDEAAECRKCLERRVESAGYKIVTDRGDWRA
ncbi:[FeFe] hydrogenase H-cluster radical SAM maturase HydE [Porcipelethomonas sp.]|uniref:[FeFe] hydrogenase H-cluster radical SAM maturase HydE n=1 Tax=Porcipelethomonas sp. TaxID=2981675 RepID=UPI003EF780F3